MMCHYRCRQTIIFSYNLWSNAFFIFPEPFFFLPEEGWGGYLLNLLFFSLFERHCRHQRHRLQFKTKQISPLMSIRTLRR